MKKKGLITIIIIVVVVLAIYLWIKGAYNGCVTRQESLESQWAQVENVYQRRADLVPNLVATVKGYAAHEEGTLTAVIEARAKATSITLDPSDLEPEDIAKFQAAQDQLSGALSRLLVTV
ncbi:MAG: LemA family protein, partial [Bacteroidales bacterium]|nr:LemA family protein [Bacteroidales bacterium]